MERQTKLIWEQPDWLEQANDWILTETARQAIEITGAIKQSHIYPWSTVMSVPTNEGTLFFKASTQDVAPEAALTQALAGWYPNCMPELVAVDAGRGWILMRDGGEPLRASIRPAQDLAPWTPVISLYAEVQIGLAHWDLQAQGSAAREIREHRARVVEGIPHLRKDAASVNIFGAGAGIDSRVRAGAG